MIRITRKIAIDEGELREEFVRASGPGGQNVNKAATAVQLRFNVINSPSLDEDVRARLIRLAGRRVNAQGELVISAGRHRTQSRNRRDALDRLLSLIRRAATAPKLRRKTKPSAGAKKRRREAKHRRGEIKRLRKAVTELEE